MIHWTLCWESIVFNLKVGQVLEFIEPAHATGRLMEKGTRVRVGAIMSELLESQVTVVILGEKTPESLTVDRHILTLHCRPVRESA